MIRPAQITFLLTILLLSTGLTLGFTYLPCYASLCSESYLPYETRLHIATFYGLLASTGCFLFLTSLSPAARRLSNIYISQKELPLLNKRLTLGGIALTLWILGLVLATTAFWVEPQLSYWERRTGPLDWAEAKLRLAVTGIIGHHADLLLGLVIIPVSRNSIMGRVFAVQQSALLFAHKMLAYLLFVAALAHGAAYYTFVGAFRPASPAAKSQFNIDNPTQTLAEAESSSPWYYATLPTGMIGFLLMVLIIITSLPALRRRSYNTFYYVHIICSFGVFLTLSVHASTDFYFLLPGLLLWVADWGWRLFRGERGGLARTVVAKLENAGEGWYRVTLAATTNSVPVSDADAEKQNAVTTHHPIQSYNLIFPEISKVQNHAFTAAKVSDETRGPVFLLQRAQGKKTQNKLDKEWTWKLGSLVPTPDGPHRSIEARVEGPYIPNNASGFATAKRVVCIVGGTGVTGACSLALWWIRYRSQDAAAKFNLVWTVRQRSTSLVPEWVELEAAARQVDSLELKVHVSSEEGRVDAAQCLRPALESGEGGRREASGKGWVYVSGPEGLLFSTEAACVSLRKEIRRGRETYGGVNWCVEGLEWYSAKWEV